MGVLQDEVIPKKMMETKMMRSVGEFLLSPAEKVENVICVKIDYECLLKKKPGPSDDDPGIHQ